MQRILLIVHTSTIMAFNYAQKGQEFNSGNQVFVNAITSYFYTKKIDCEVADIFFITQKIHTDPNWAKENFDIAILPEANIFGANYKDDLLWKIKITKGLGIPVYVLGAGAQSSIDYSFNFLDKIESVAKEYLDSIFQSGGNITLRGYFTQEVLSKLGYPNCFVSGCPSLYYNGRNYEISNNKVTRDNFKPIFNGRLNDIITYCQKHNNNTCLFYDQEEFYKVIWRQDLLEKDEFNYTVKTSDRFKLLQHNQIKLFYDYKAWEDNLKEHNPSFSYGQRVHGNLISLINNIPVFIDVIDSRTREIADFYKIPNSYTTSFNIENDSLYDLYQSLDWTEFNNNLKIKFDNFKKFFEDNKIETVFGDNYEYKEQQEGLKYKTPEISTASYCKQQEKSFKKYLFLKRTIYKKPIIKILCLFIPVKLIRKRLRKLYL